MVIYGRIMIYGKDIGNYDDLVGGLEHESYFPLYWEYSSQLTNIFQRGSIHQPECFVFQPSGNLTSLWTNHHVIAGKIHYSNAPFQ